MWQGHVQIPTLHLLLPCPGLTWPGLPHPTLFYNLTYPSLPYTTVYTTLPYHTSPCFAINYTPPCSTGNCTICFALHKSTTVARKTAATVEHNLLAANDERMSVCWSVSPAGIDRSVAAGGQKASRVSRPIHWPGKTGGSDRGCRGLA